MNKLAVLRAFVRRDWDAARSYRFAFAFQFFGIFSELVLFYFLSRIVDQRAIAQDSVGDQGYFAFVIVARMLLAMVSHSATTFSHSVNREQTSGSLEALMMTPQDPAFVVASSAAYASISVVVVELLTILVAVVLFGLRFDTSLLAALGALLSGVACLVFFGAVGLAVAGGTLVVKRGVGTTAGFGLRAMALLSGVFYPTDVLPEPLQFVASLLPLTWGVDLLRAALYENDFLIERFALLLVAAVVALPIGLWCFRTGLDRAKHEGSLAQY